MIEQWLTAIEDLILDAPGNSDLTAGAVWESTLARLGESGREAARERRILWDFLEAEDTTQDRPFFVLREYVFRFGKIGSGPFLVSAGVIELAYTEATLTDAERLVDHKAAKQYFVSWTSELIASLAERAYNCGVPIAAIEQSVFPQRTPVELRDPDRPETDYFWAAWLIHVGENPAASLNSLRSHAS